MIMFKFLTKVNKANNNAKTIRTTIPKEIVNSLELEPGDDLVWNVEVVNEELKIFVSKKEE